MTKQPVQFPFNSPAQQGGPLPFFIPAPPPFPCQDTFLVTPRDKRLQKHTAVQFRFYLSIAPPNVLGRFYYPFYFHYCIPLTSVPSFLRLIRSLYSSRIAPFSSTNANNAGGIKLFGRFHWNRCESMVHCVCFETGIRRSPKRSSLLYQIPLKFYFPLFCFTFISLFLFYFGAIRSDYRNSVDRRYNGVELQDFTAPSPNTFASDLFCERLGQAEFQQTKPRKLLFHRLLLSRIDRLRAVGKRSTNIYRRFDCRLPFHEKILFNIFPLEYRLVVLRETERGTS